MTKTQVTIFDDGAELGALAAALAGGPRSLAILTELDPRDFAGEPRQALFAAMKRLAAAGRPVDSFLLISELERAGDLERVGGARRGDEAREPTGGRAFH